MLTRPFSLLSHHCCSNDGSSEMDNGLTHAADAAAGSTSVSYAGLGVGTGAGAGVGTASPRPAAVAGAMSVAIVSSSLPGYNMDDIGSLTAPPTTQRHLPSSSSSSSSSSLPSSALPSSVLPSSSVSSLPLTSSEEVGVTPQDHKGGGGGHLMDETTVTTPFLSNPPRDNDYFPSNTTTASVTGVPVSSHAQGQGLMAAGGAGRGTDNFPLIHDDTLRSIPPPQIHDDAPRFLLPPSSNLTNHNATAAAGVSAGGTTAVASTGMFDTHQHYLAGGPLAPVLTEEDDSISPRYFPPQTRPQTQEQEVHQQQQQMPPSSRPLRMPAKVRKLFD